MTFGKLRKVKCNLCENNTAFVSQTLVQTGDPKIRRMVDVKRCAVCDTTPCPNCQTRTIKVNASECPDCGTPLLPKEGRRR